ncbi:MAG: glycosyltransferase [Terriglobales bacterium]
MTGFCKYLVRHGWHSTVLTALVTEGDLEPALLDTLPPEVRVVRTRYRKIFWWETGAAAGLRKLGALQPPSGNNAVPSSLVLDAWVRRLGNFVRSCVYFPDQFIGWIPSALAEAIRLHRQQPFDVVYCTSPPRSSLIVGWLMKVLLRARWVLELMDPWYPPPTQPLRRRFEHWLLERLLRSADAVVVMVQGHADDLHKTFGVPPEKMTVVRNGFDEDDFQPEPEPNAELMPPGFLHFSHFGTVYPENSGLFFPALAELVEEQPELRQRLRVNVFGYPHEPTIRRYAQEGPLADVLRIHGFIQHHSRILQYMRASDLLLLFWGRPDFSRMAAAGKTYEYLRVGRPIFAVSHAGGAVHQLVEEGEAGWVADPANKETIKQRLRQALEALPSNHNRPRRPEFVAQFRYENLAGTLATAFDKVAAHGRRT